MGKGFFPFLPPLGPRPFRGFPYIYSMIFLKHKTMVDHLGDPYEGHVSIDMFANAAGKNGMSNGPHGMAAAMAAAMSGLGQFHKIHNHS